MVELQFEIVTECKLKCIHCSSFNARIEYSRCYSDDDILYLVSLFETDIKVIFTGGEPLQYKNFFQLCEKIHFRFPLAKLTVYTSGTINNNDFISKSYAKKMKKAGIEECYISIYSNSEKKHDRWTGICGSFNNALLSLQSLLCAGIDVRAHIVIGKTNSKEIEDIVEFCRNAGFLSCRLLKLAPVGNAIFNWEEIGTDNIDIKNIIKRIWSYYYKKDFYISVAGFPDIMPCRDSVGSYGCQAGTRVLYIDINGDIYPCACCKGDKRNNLICNIQDENAVANYVKSIKLDAYMNDCINHTII